MRIKQLEINEPIWSTRSIGIAVKDYANEDVVEITISTTRKSGPDAGKPVYPGKYYIRMGRALKEGTYQKRRGVELVVVPIANLSPRPEDEFPVVHMGSIWNKQDRAEVNKKAREEANERRGFDDRERIPPGVMMLTIGEVKGEAWTWKKHADKATHGEVERLDIMVEPFDAVSKEKYRPIRMDFNINKEGHCGFSDRAIEVGLSKLATFFQDAFGLEGIPDASNLQDLVRKVKSYCGKPFQAAIQHEEDIFETDEGEVKFFARPRVYYVGAHDDSSFTGPSEAKKFIRLKGKKAEMWKRQQQINEGGGALPGEKVSSTFDDEEGDIF